VFVHVLQFGRPDRGNLRAGEHDCWHRVVVDGNSLVTEGVFDSVVALFGGNRLQFGLADHVTGRIHVRIRRLEVLVDKNSPVVVRLHSNCLKADILAVGLTPVATNSASP